MILRNIILLLLFGLIATSCNTTESKTNQPQETTNDSLKTSSIEIYNRIGQGLLSAVVVGDSADAIAYSVEEAMEKYKVPAVGVTVFMDGEIVWSKHYGHKQSDSLTPINKNTLFQVASISKAITALGIMKLVDKYGLDLDADVNQYLTSWKATGKVLKEEKVTVRRLLNHTSGAIDKGFHGYSKTEKIPSILEVIEGKGHSPKVEFKTIPGSNFAYSGGGYAILQLLVEDFTGKRFEDFYQEEVFTPLGMSNSTFQQPTGNNIALAHDSKGQPLPEGWLVFPELTAAGMWTTSEDLAKFSIALEDSYHGKENAFISQDLAKDMLTVTKVWGLGIGVRGEGDLSYFFHGGGNPGSYKGLFTSCYQKRVGIAITTNAGKGDKLHDDLLRSFSSVLQLGMFQPKYIQPFELSRMQISQLEGNYHFQKAGDYFLEIITDESDRIVLYDPNDETRVTFVAKSPTEFIDIESGNSSSFEIDSITGKVIRMNYSGGAYVFQKVK